MIHKDKLTNTVVVSNKLFKLLWNESTKYSQEDICRFIDHFSSFSSPDRIEYMKIGFDSSSFQEFLKKIFYYSHLSFKDILDLTHYGITEFSDAFCIPLATVKTWVKKTGSNCSPYTILLYLKYFDLLDFGSIQIQESIKRSELIESVSNSKIDNSYASKNELSIADSSKPISTSENITDDPPSPPVRRGPFHNMSTEETLSRIYGASIFKR